MSRQPTSVEASQAEFDDEEAVSGTGEGDEIMEEVEEQEDGYCACFSSLATRISLCPGVMASRKELAI